MTSPLGQCPCNPSPPILDRENYLQNHIATLLFLWGPLEIKSTTRKILGPKALYLVELQIPLSQVRVVLKVWWICQAR
jgi:hypothetical protein